MRKRGQRKTWSEFTEEVTVLKALASEPRLIILSHLKEKNLCGEELQDILKLDLSTVSKHLRKLWLAKLVASETIGHRWVYHIIDPSVFDLIEKTKMFSENLKK